MYGDWCRKASRAVPNPKEEQTETLLLEIESSDTRQKSQSTASRLCIAFLFLMSFCGVAGLGAWFGSRWHIDPDHFCAAHASQYCNTPCEVCSVSGRWLTDF